jgi:hypothetical protein
MSTRTLRVIAGTAFSLPGNGTSVCEIGAEAELASAGVSEPLGDPFVADDAEAAGAALVSEAAGAELDVLPPSG